MPRVSKGTEIGGLAEQWHCPLYGMFRKPFGEDAGEWMGEGRQGHQTG
jgi:hypothetical protein